MTKIPKLSDWGGGVGYKEYIKHTDELYKTLEFNENYFFLFSLVFVNRAKLYDYI